MGWIALGVGLATLLGSIFSGMYNQSSTRDTNELQERLADQANQWQIQNRDYENWYNSPAGLQTRGLNPALAMSAAGGSLAQSATAGAANLPSDLKAPQLPDFGQSIAGAAQSATSVGLAQSQIENIDAQTELTNAEAELKKKELPIKEQQYINMKQEFNNMIRENQRMSAEIRRLGAAEQKDVAETTNIWKMYNLEERKVDALIEQMRSESAYKDALTKLTNRDVWERAATWTLRLNGLDLQNQEIAARAGLERAQTTTEWFKAQDYAASTMLKGSMNFKTYTEGYLLALGIPEAELNSRGFATDAAIANTPFGGFIQYVNHVFGRAAAPILNRFSLGVKFGSNSSTIKSSSYRSPTKLQ